MSSWANRRACSNKHAMAWGVTSAGVMPLRAKAVSVTIICSGRIPEAAAMAVTASLEDVGRTSSTRYHKGSDRRAVACARCFARSICAALASFQTACVDAADAAFDAGFFFRGGRFVLVVVPAPALDAFVGLALDDDAFLVGFAVVPVEGAAAEPAAGAGAGAAAAAAAGPAAVGGFAGALVDIVCGGEEDSDIR
jgi:hypothetical protein